MHYPVKFVPAVMYKKKSKPDDVKTRWKLSGIKYSMTYNNCDICRFNTFPKHMGNIPLIFGCYQLLCFFEFSFTIEKLYFVSVYKTFNVIPIHPITVARLGKQIVNYIGKYSFMRQETRDLLFQQLPKLGKCIQNKHKLIWDLIISKVWSQKLRIFIQIWFPIRNVFILI